MLAIALGSLGHLEKIFEYKFNKKVHWALLSIFIGISVSQFILSGKEIKTLKDELKKEQLTIRKFDSKLSVKFSGNWQEGVGTKPFWHDRPALFFIGDQNKTVATFYTNAPFSLKDIDSKHAIYETTQSIHSGDYPIGFSIDELNNIKRVEYTIPFLGMTTPADITLESEELEFFINGESIGKLISKPNLTGKAVKDKGAFYFPVTISFEKNGFYQYILKNKQPGTGKM